MAIDTQNKRRSVQAYGGAIVYPLADGTISSADREHVSWLYAGIPVSPPSTRHGHRQRIGIRVGMGMCLVVAAGLLSRLSIHR